MIHVCPCDARALLSGVYDAACAHDGRRVRVAVGSAVRGDGVDARLLPRGEHTLTRAALRSLSCVLVHS